MIHKPRQPGSLISKTYFVKTSSSSTLLYREKRTDLLLLHKVSHLTNIVRAEPELAKELWDSGGVHFLNKLTKSRHSEVRRKARLVLAIAGHPPPYPKQGLRILAIDGGGTR